MQILVRPPRMRCLADALAWGVMLAPDLIVTRQAEFMTVLLYRPRDLASSSPEQLVSARKALNAAVRRFGRGWALWFECQRNETAEYETADWPDPVSRLIDDQRRALFTQPGTQFATDYFVTLLYAPPADAVGKLAAHFEENLAERRTADRRFQAELETFRRGVAAFREHLASGMPHVAPLSGDALLTYLHSTVSTRRQWVRMPPLPCFLAEYLSDEDYISGYAPMLGEHHLRTIRIKAQPDETIPGIFDALNYLTFPYRNVARWLPYAREDAERELSLRKRMWADRRKSLAQKILARFVADDGSRDNVDATRRMEEADGALLALASGDFSFGLWSHTITVTDPDLDVVEDRCKAVQQVLSAAGFLSQVARHDAMSAWIGSLPGHPQGDLGRFLACSLTFAEVLPATAVWTGPERDRHLGGPPLLRCLSDGGTPFRLALHQDGSDVGHALVIGQTGAGKSVLLGAMIAAHRKYPGSRVVVLDRGSSALGICLALGGSFHRLASDDAAVSLQPLAFIDEAAELAWAFEFVLGCLAQEGVAASPAQKQQITQALQNLATRPPRQRTLTTLRALVQDETVKVALDPFCLGGACGDLLDNDEHRLGIGADVVCYETAALLERPSAVGPVLATVFHAIERGFDGRPTLLVVDEAWSALDHPLLAAKLRQWLKTARKANVAVVMATQSLADIAASQIREALSESCPTRIFTANTRARERATAATYAGFGLTDEQIAIVSELRPKAEYVFTAPGAWRTFELGLSALELALIGRNRPEDQAAMLRLLAAGPREDFAWRWLRHCGFDEADIAGWRERHGAPAASSLQAAE
jgi:type IV secretion system protein VirB4